MINANEVVETNKMVSFEHLDVRTVTMGISLLDCVSDDIDVLCERVHDKIVSKAKNLVKICDDIANEIGIPIVNKRISVTPISLITARTGNAVKVAKTLDACADEIGVDFVGGYSSLVQKGMTDYEKEFISSIPEALSSTKKVCASVNIGSPKAGIHMDAVALMGKIVKETA